MEPLLDFVQASPFALWSLVGLLILCGVGLPMPEDIILLAAGLIAGETGRSWLYTSLLMYVGVLAGDSLIFGIGQHFGRRLLAMPWTTRWLSSGKRERIARLFERHGSTAYFFARFMPGLRAPIFCTAGAMKGRYLHFVLFDGAAALISVPVFVWIGSFLWTRFGGDLVQLSAAMSRTHSYSLAIAFSVMCAVAGVVWLSRRRLVRSR